MKGTVYSYDRRAYRSIEPASLIDRRQGRARDPLARGKYGKTKFCTIVHM